MPNKKMKLRALLDFTVEDEGVEIEVKANDVFEVSKEMGKYLKEEGVAQAPSKYVNRGIRCRLSPEQQQQLIDDLEKLLAEFKDSE